MAIKSKTRQSNGHTATSWSSGVTQPRRGHPAIGSGDITHLCSQITTKSGQIINCWFFFSDSLGLPSFFSSSSSCQLLTEQINCCVSTELQPASAIPNAAAIYECTLLMPSVVTPRQHLRCYDVNKRNSPLCCVLSRCSGLHPVHQRLDRLKRDIQRQSTVANMINYQGNA